MEYSEAVSPIIERCRKGEKAAYYELYNLYAKAMLNVSIRIVIHKEEAEDVLQEAFLSAFQNIHKFDGKFSFGAWLKRIVINRSLDVLKKKKLNFISLDQTDYPEEQTNENDDQINYDITVIKNGMQELPDGYRIIVSLYLFEEYSHKEIAEMLAIIEGTSKSKYSRARKKLVEIIRYKTSSHVR